MELWTFAQRLETVAAKMINMLLIQNEMVDRLEMWGSTLKATKNMLFGILQSGSHLPELNEKSHDDTCVYCM